MAKADTLTEKQRTLLTEYVRNGGNGTEAARVAGHKGTDAIPEEQNETCERQCLDEVECKHVRR